MAERKPNKCPISGLDVPYSGFGRPSVYHPTVIEKLYGTKYVEANKRKAEARRAKLEKLGAPHYKDRKDGDFVRLTKGRNIARKGKKNRKVKLIPADPFYRCIADW
jgi:hypothetical protein